MSCDGHVKEDEPVIGHRSAEEDSLNNNVNGEINNDNNVLALPISVRVDDGGGGGRNNNVSSTAYVTVGMLEMFRKQLEEQFHPSFKSLRMAVKRVEDKCDIALAKIPILEIRTEEVAKLAKEVVRLTKELDAERKRRVENEENFSDCVDKLMEEIVQVGVKIEELQRKLAETEKRGLEKMEGFRQELLSLQRLVSSLSSAEEGSHISSSVSGNENDAQGQSSSGIQVQEEEQPQPSSNNTISFTVEDKTAANNANCNSNGNENQVIHRRAAQPGKNKPFACLCGREYSSKDTLSQHVIGEQSMEELLQDLMASETTVEQNSATPPPLLPSTSASSGSNSVLQQQNNQKTTRTRRGRPRGRGRRTIPYNGNGNNKEHGKDPAKPRVCLCGKEFRTVRYLSAHIRYHAKEKVFACKVCGKSFAFAYLLKQHLERDHKYQPGEITNADLLTGCCRVQNEHTRSTTAAASISAAESIAGSGSSKQMTIVQVQNKKTVHVHPGAPINNKAQSQAGNKRHGRHPTKHFYCLCGLKYRTNVNLYDHLRFFNGRNLLTCNCRRKFVYASQLKAHMKQAHKKRLRLQKEKWQHLAIPAAVAVSSGAGSSTVGLHQIKMEEGEEELVDASEPPGKKYCICYRGTFGDMVACDNKECPREWFHFGCVGLTAVPTGKWFCPPCLLTMKD